MELQLVRLGRRNAGSADVALLVLLLGGGPLLEDAQELGRQPQVLRVLPRILLRIHAGAWDAVAVQLDKIRRNLRRR